jgi:phenylpropionate dioxygenase-like ring-hydroxylating dioxygenase large terminal subunit
MLSREENECLTRTGPGTPMGNVFRSYWLPVLLSEQLAEPAGGQVRVKVLGEELLAFRDSKGRVGLVEPRCPHRGANLYFARNEEGGLRCVFHGWKFDVQGNCLEMPTMPPERYATLCEKARIKAYPVREYAGYIWAWMGDGAEPELPQLEFALVPPSHRYVSKKLQECNWAQAAEGGVDTAHFSFLHQPVTHTETDLVEKSPLATRGFARETMSHEHVRWMRDDTRPRYEVRGHEAGLVLAGCRDAGPGEHYWRIAQYLMPSHAYTPSATPGQTYHAQCWVPIDDESCWVFLYSWNPDRPLTAEERDSYRKGGAVYPELDADWKPLRNRSNDYLIDRGLQKTENFTGIIGVSEQDAAIQDSQGRIADRTREMLGATDLGVVRFRRLMLDAAKTVAAGGDAPAVAAPRAYRVRAGGIVTRAEVPFDEVMRMRFGDALGFIRDKEKEAR